MSGFESAGLDSPESSGGSASSVADPELIARIESHSVFSWPPDVIEQGPHGWLLRATPGLDRGRSNHALTPSVSLPADHAAAGVAAATEFASRFGIPLGLQIGPVHCHEGFMSELLDQGWRVGSVAVVMGAAPTSVLTSGDVEPLELVFCDHADAGWLAAWAACEPERVEPRPGSDIDSHLATVFPKLAGRARFARFGESAVGIVVEQDGLLGMFCLAVSPGERRRGLGKGLVKGLLVGTGCEFAYLQVLSDNVPGLALYRSLGFEPVYRYCHCLAP